MRNLSVAALFVLVAVCQVAAQPQQRRDGNWWREQGAPNKNHYIGGFFDALQLGLDMSVWDIPRTITGDLDPAVNKASTSFASHIKRYFTNVSSFQVIDGLNTFYDDYRNRRIRVDRALWLVLNNIAGTPKAELDAMVENHRKNANELP